jgi:hypothetical protein
MYVQQSQRTKCFIFLTTINIKGIVSRDWGRLYHMVSLDTIDPKEGTPDVKPVYLICTNWQLRGGKFVSV